MATLEIYGAYGLPIDIVSLTNEMQQVIHDLGKIITGNGIQPKSSQRHAYIVIEWVNIEEEEQRERN